MSFFTGAPHTFTTIPAGDIPSQQFLDACSCIIPVFDALGPTAFAPVKSDINGNIKKLRGKLEQDPAKFSTLQAMVADEIAKKTTTSSGSATDALLWLKRALSFIQVFLQEVLKGNPDMTACASTAYDSTLAKYHNFLVRGIFSLAVRAVPTREGFLKELAKGTCDDATLLAQMKEYVDALTTHLNTINTFYDTHKLDN
eukprot:m.224496 g.224496  ORF g.224496 m.224496 type:complete len:199 (-) comp11097_c0_seq1:61-657(-)